MSRLAADLLDHAGRLCGLDPAVQSNADRRRAISAAYYALFHTLAEEAAALFASDPALTPAIRANLASKVRRMVSHTEVRDHAETFRRTREEDPSPSRPPQYNLKKFLKDLLAEPNPTVPEALEKFARTFVRLQTERELADYERDYEVSPVEASKHVQDAADALDQWSRTRTEPIAQAFIASLLLEKRGRR
jgi:uncharacterized protein (UPF0332 family)